MCFAVSTQQPATLVPGLAWHPVGAAAYMDEQAVTLPQERMSSALGCLIALRP